MRRVWITPNVDPDLAEELGARILESPRSRIWIVLNGTREVSEHHQKGAAVKASRKIARQLRCVTRVIWIERE